MTTLTLLRHAPTAAEPGTVVGHTDVALSATGRSAARALAEQLAHAWSEWASGPDTGPRPTRLFSSDLGRAVDTARPIAQALDLPLTTDARLRELDFGDWEGRSWDAIHAEQPDTLAAWGADWVHTAPPGGESFTTLMDRAAAWLADATADAPTSLLAVAHAGAIRALLCHALDLPATAAFRLAVHHLQPTVLLRDASQAWTLAHLNAAPIS